jgi:hypothetical protein
MNQTDPDILALALSQPFAPEKLGWKPQSVSGSRALAIAYIDARDVMDRLDAAVGPENWQDEYAPQANGTVVCRLAVRVNGEWITKCDVGGESDQKDAGDREKAAFSDALKRAAVKWGVGRYLYSLPAVWCDYDPQKKQLLKTPNLPAWALPRKNGNGAPAGAVTDPHTIRHAASAEQMAAAAVPARQQPSDKLSIEQERELSNLLEKTGTPAAAVLDAYKVKALAELPYVHYGEAVSGLKRKSAAQQKVADIVKRKGLRWVDVEKDMKSRWGKEKVEELDGKQLRALVEMLESQGDAKE